MKKEVSPLLVAGVIFLLLIGVGVFGWRYLNNRPEPLKPNPGTKWNPNMSPQEIQKTFGDPNKK